MTEPKGIIRVTPVLFCAPVFWTREFWTESAHAWDWVRAETPLNEKPCVELEVSLDVTLGEVFAVACDAWGIQPGRDLLEAGGARADHFLRFAFVREDQDAAGVDVQEGYRWPSFLPVAREDGTVERFPALEITYRELLVSSSLHLLDGDVTRPYVHSVIPQGDVSQVVEIARVTAEAVRAAYASVDDAVGYMEHTIRLVRASFPEVHKVAEQVIDDGIRVAAAAGFLRWLRGVLARHRRPPWMPRNHAWVRLGRRRWRSRVGYDRYTPRRTSILNSDELPFCAPDDAIGVMVTHILELPRGLRVPENFRLLVSEPRDGRFPDVPSSVLMHVLGADSHQLDDERVPTIRLDLRTAAVRVKMPLQAADICFQDWERPLLSRSRWRERSRSLKKARRFGIEAPVTVVAGTCLLPVDDWGTTCEQQEAALESSLDASLDLMNSFVLSLGLMANDPSFGPFERGDLPFLCPVIVESFPMPHGRSGQSFLREIHDHPPDVGQFPDFPKPLFEAATALATSDHAHDEPFFLFYELFQRAQSTLLSQRTAQSVLATGTAIEVVLNTVVREASVALGETESRRMGILSAPLASIVRDHLARYTNMAVDLDDPDNVAGAWWENGYDLRNRVAHAGYRPSMEEAVRAFDSASELVLAMRDGLLNRAETETVGQSLGWGRREERQEWDEALGLPDRPE